MQFGIFVLQLGGLITILACTLFGIAPTTLTLQVKPDGLLVVICFGIWFLVIGWLVGLFFLNSFPTIWTNEQGLVLSAFFFLRVFVPWTDIVNIGIARVPFGDVLILARHITPFHRIYGWFYSRTLYPGFLIGRGMNDRDELLREIRQRAKIIV